MCAFSFYPSIFFSRRLVTIAVAGRTRERGAALSALCWGRYLFRQTYVCAASLHGRSWIGTTLCIHWRFVCAHAPPPHPPHTAVAVRRLGWVWTDVVGVRRWAAAWMASSCLRSLGDVAGGFIVAEQADELSVWLFAATYMRKLPLALSCMLVSPRHARRLILPALRPLFFPCLFKTDSRVSDAVGVYHAVWLTGGGDSGRGGHLLLPSCGFRLLPAAWTCSAGNTTSPATAYAHLRCTLTAASLLPAHTAFCAPRATAPPSVSLL